MTDLFKLLCCLLLIMVMFLLVMGTIYVGVILYKELKDEAKPIVKEFKHDSRPIYEQLEEVFGKKEK